MGANPIENYLARLEPVCKRRSARIESMVETLQRIAHHLRNWRSVVIGGAAGFSYPATANAPNLPIREHDWPQLQPLRSAMQEWHRTKCQRHSACSRSDCLCRTVCPLPSSSWARNREVRASAR